MFLFFATIEDIETRSKLEIIYEKYSKPMFYKAFDVLKNRSDAEDAVQEAFMRLLKNIQIIKDPQSPEMKGLVMVIAENCAIDIYRKRNRLKEVELDEMSVPDIREVEYRGENQIVAEIMRLNPKYTEILLLRYFHELEYYEIASCLNITEVNARQLLKRAKDKLEKLCEKKGLL